MIRRRKRRIPIISDSSEDDSLQPRMPFKSSKMQSPRSENHTVFLKDLIQMRKQENDGWSSDSSLIQRRRKQGNKLPIITSGESSSSDDEELVHPIRRGALRELSEYETGYSSDKTRDASPDNSDIEDRKSLKPLWQEVMDTDAARNEQVGEIGYTSLTNALKKAGITRRISTCCLQVPRAGGSKRMRIVSSDEESDPIRLKKQDRSVRNRIEVRKVRRNNIDTSSTEYSDGPSTSGSIRLMADRSQAAGISGSTDFGTSLLDSLVKRTSTIVAQNTLSNSTNERVILTSNINDCPRLSISDSDDSFPIKTSGKRGARVALHESDEDAGLQYPSTLKDMSLDSSSDESEYCPICFMHFNSQEVGTPANCAHHFCLTCIQEWAKNNNTCPVDRMRFNSIIVRSYNSRNVIREIPVETVMPVTLGMEDEWNLMDLTIPSEDESSSESDGMDDSYDSTNDDGPDEVCSICYAMARNDNVILCDFCLNVFHLTCLQPPLRFIPAGHWFCPDCAGIYSAGTSSESSSE